MGDIRLIGFFGDFGSYKTALCTAFVIQIADALGLPICSNYKIEHPRAIKFDMSDLLALDADDTVYAIDEIMMSGFDSRSSMSGENKFGSYWVAQSRKSRQKGGAGNYVCYTSQLMSEADLRVFELTDMKFLLKKNDEGDCEFECVTGSDCYNDGVIPRAFFEEYSFGRYDTNEKIMPLGVEFMRVNMERFNAVKMNKRIDDVVERILGEYRFGGWKDVQRFTVADFLRREGLPENLCVGVFDRLREKVRVG